jgi:putative ABC transport system substrate-binding protein
VNSAATNAARKATSTIPIVMTAVNDPVEWGLIKSLERPGTNVTGTTLNAPQLAGERLRILKRLVPNHDRISMLIVASNGALARTADVVRRDDKSERSPHRRPTQFRHCEPRECAPDDRLRVIRNDD